MPDSVVILGARGSVPVSGPGFSRYGGATSCVLVRLAGQPVLLDAGTGMLSLSGADAGPELPVLLSHPHADHLLGLPMCPLLRDPARRFEIRAVPRGGLDAEAQLKALMSPPLWPVGPEQLPAKLVFRNLPERLALGAVTVETMEGVHPGGVTLIRLSGGGKRVVFATDCTLTDELLPGLRKFAENCDLLLCDGQYSPGEWAGRGSFGHSTWEMAARLGRDCGAKRLRIIHHGPDKTDDMLDAAARELSAIYPGCAFGREGEEILL